MNINFNRVEFVRSAAEERQFLRDKRPQIVFAGRSNVGKSSVINRIVNRKNFAYVGATPGKTAQINYFLVDNAIFLVDLPGYGYAKAPQSERERWGRLVESYFAAEGLLTLGVMIVDARHKPTEDDCTMYTWFRTKNCPCVVVANKLDKLKKSEIEPNLQTIRDALHLRETDMLLPFSAETGVGKNALLSALADAVR